MIISDMQNVISSLSAFKNYPCGVGLKCCWLLKERPEIGFSLFEDNQRNIIWTLRNKAGVIERILSTEDVLELDLSNQTKDEILFNLDIFGGI